MTGKKNKLLLSLCAIIAIGIIACDFSFGKKPGEDNNGSWKQCLRYDDNRWNKTIGPEYIEKAFLAARAADPDAKLYYNDYNLNNANKAQAVFNMVSDINRRYPDVSGRQLIDGIGMQSHHHLNTSPQTVRASMQLFSALGVDIAITEMDIIAADSTSINMNLGPWSETNAKRQADLYAAMFSIFREYSAYISQVIFWGLDDGTSWRSPNYPTLLDKNYGLKPAFYSIAGINTDNPETWESVQPLQEIFENYFPVGNIIRNTADFTNTARFGILKRHFNIVTAENDMKPDAIAPNPAPVSAVWNYRFANADTIVNNAGDAGFTVNGHTLVWHSQTPAWLTNGSNAVVLENLEKYVTDVVTHFRGKIISWDVVNEAMRDNLTANDFRN